MGPDIEHLISAALTSWQINIRVAAIAKVTAYDAATRTCKALPVTRRPVETDVGEIVYEDQPEIQNVMVHAFGGGELTLTAPLTPGDTVLLVYLDFSPAIWRKSGQVSDTPDTRQNGPSYPVAIPFYRPTGGAGEDTDPSIGKPGGLRVHFTDDTVNVGGGGDFVALKPAVDAIQNNLDTLASFGTPWGPTTPGNIAAVGAQASSTTLKAD
jgi:hypothetical protein